MQIQIIRGWILSEEQERDTVVGIFKTRQGLAQFISKNKKSALWGNSIRQDQILEFRGGPEKSTGYQNQT